jgi:hypothetical protein
VCVGVSVGVCEEECLTGVCVGVSQWECVYRSVEVGRNISLSNPSKLGEPGHKTSEGGRPTY